MPQVYTVAIAGLGKRGKVHADLFHTNERFKVVGIADVDEGRIADAAAISGNPATFKDAGEMLNAVKPDVFCFCTPPTVRLPLIKLGCEAGVKLIAYEKPMATSMTEAIEIRDLLNASGVKSVMSHQRKYNQQFVEVRKLIDAGALGRIENVYATCTGWMMHMATHLADYMRYFNPGADVEWVIGMAHGREKLTDNHPSPDYLGGFIQFNNGVRGTLETGSLAPDVPEVEYWWRKVRVGAQGTEGFAECFVGGGWRAVTKDGVFSGEGTWDSDHEQKPYIEDIALYLDGTKVHPCSGEDAFKDQEIMCGLIRSAVERRQIVFPLGPGEHELRSLERTLPE
ncbi:MAG TPA: Gfo/Idh/MocA family oxidoreductase [Armatimonadota bacterium]|jgi:predicted dehydrogenase